MKKKVDEDYEIQLLIKLKRFLRKKKNVTFDQILEVAHSCMNPHSDLFDFFFGVFFLSVSRV